MFYCRYVLLVLAAYRCCSRGIFDRFQTVFSVLLDVCLIGFRVPGQVSDAGLNHLFVISGNYRSSHLSFPISIGGKTSLSLRVKRNILQFVQ